MERLKDKVVLITGAGRGIGRSMAVNFAKEGATVVVNDIDGESAEKVSHEIKEKRKAAIPFHADVSDVRQVEDMVKAILDRFHRIDVLVNNVAIAIYSSLKAHTETEWDEVMSVNLKSVFYCCKAVLNPMIKQRKGRIINISSMLGIHGGPFEISYATSKGAINAFTKSLAREVGEYGVTVNAICPALVKTDLSNAYLMKAGKSYAKAVQSLWRFCPVNRELEPQDVANLAIYLASDESDFVTGQLLKLDGGLI